VHFHITRVVGQGSTVFWLCPLKGRIKGNIRNQKVRAGGKAFGKESPAVSGKSWVTDKNSYKHLRRKEGKHDHKRILCLPSAPSEGIELKKKQTENLHRGRVPRFAKELDLHRGEGICL